MIRKLITIAIKSSSRRVHSLLELPYPYQALEPVISSDILSLHHTRHHRAYTTNSNAADKKLKGAFSERDITAAISLEPALRFNRVQFKPLDFLEESHS
ncbi:Sod Fe N domain containing protein [Asbolus verrucosus]|uniref:superoxide dismutase n=1 Tax=Asbolus verrucosus TaxID=1661398 RepID=A0A482W2K9_ASBVE|nr:Sod Fe N domain containing protein [Asbolus verrucosus]